MSIENVIRRFAVQTAVHWATPVNDGTGYYTYDTPVEIKVRWDEATKIISNRKSKEIISNASILTNTELVEEEIVYLGTLVDLTALDLDIDSGATYPHPSLVEGAHKIMTREKTPMPRSTTDFARVYYLKPNWEQKV